MVFFRKKIVSTRFLLLFLLLIFSFPLFPNFFGSSQLHINFICLLFISLCFILSKVSFYNSDFIDIVLYYFSLQFFLFISFYTEYSNAELGLSSLFSLFRPMLLYLLFVVMYSLSKSLPIHMKDFEFFLRFFISISFCYLVIELFLIDYFSEIVFSLYKREERESLLNAGTIFFGTTYYSGFIYFTLMLFCLAMFEIDKKFNSFVFCLLSFLLVIFAQSKIMWLSTILGLWFFLLLSSSFYFKFFAISIFSILLFFYCYLEEVFYFLSSFGLTSISSLKTILFNPSGSGTLNVRLEQIFSTFELVSEQLFFFGVGLGRDVELESWVALFLYRYGIWGVIFFCFIFMTLLYKSWFAYLYLADTRLKVYAKACIVWVICLPITQLSSPMLETSKMSVLCAFVFVLTTVLYGFARRKVFKRN